MSIQQRGICCRLSRRHRSLVQVVSGSETPPLIPDVIFISQLIDKIEALYNVDWARIYANGMSNGGGMSFVLSCTLSDRIAAVGMVSPGLYPHSNWCTDRRAVPVIAFHGSADPIAPYNGGRTKFGDDIFPSVPRFMAEWARRNQCRPNPLESAVAADVTRLLYTDCADDAAVVLYKIEGEGHRWPGGKPDSGQMDGRPVQPQHRCDEADVGVFSCASVSKEIISVDSSRDELTVPNRCAAAPHSLWRSAAGRASPRLNRPTPDWATALKDKRDEGATRIGAFPYFRE